MRGLDPVVGHTVQKLAGRKASSESAPPRAGAAPASGSSGIDGLLGAGGL